MRSSCSISPAWRGPGSPSWPSRCSTLSRHARAAEAKRWVRSALQPSCRAGIRPGVSRTLENADFAYVKFERLLIGPGTPPQSTVRVANCSFSSCMVGGEFRIAPGVELENVVFVEVSSPDLMTINTEAVLKNVIVRGSSKLRGLWVKRGAFSNPERQRLCQGWSSAAADDAFETAQGTRCT